MPRHSLACLLVVAACGGSQSQTPASPPPGDTHVTPTAPDVAPPAPGETQTPPTPPQPEERAMRPPPLPLPLAEGTTIELKNDGDGDLMFSTTKGWQPVIFAYTGKPPKAKSVMLFEGYCTASCDVPGDGVCPVCAPPKNKKEELAMAKSETAAAGGSVKVPWDGKVLVYDKAPGKKHCKCWKKADPPADTYTIKACGLRPSKEPGKASKPVCTETQAALGGGLPPTITLSFGK
jgi:hypothetical protein